MKLGAVALAALAILEHPDGELFRKEYEALVAMTDTLWREDGSFQNFHRPQARNADPNFHNFYPGETLLLWATMLNVREDPQRARRFYAKLSLLSRLASGPPQTGFHTLAHPGLLPPLAEHRG